MPAFSGYAQTGYYKPGYVKPLVAPPPEAGMAFPTPAIGTFVAAGPTLTEQVARLVPRGPYGIVTALVLTTHAGDRIFSEVAVDPIYTVPPAIGRHVTLLSLDSISLSNGGSGSTLVTRVTSTQLPGFSFTVSNEDGMISQLVATELLLGMTVSLYSDYGDGINVFRGRGEIQEVTITRRTATFRVGA